MPLFGMDACLVGQEIRGRKNKNKKKEKMRSLFVSQILVSSTVDETNTVH